MTLTTEERIYVRTHNGEREIQLCLGDITMLPKEEAVDVIIVSAYPGTSMGFKFGFDIFYLSTFVVDAQNN